MEKSVKTKLFIAIDVHKRQWSVSIFTAHLHHKTFSQSPQPEVLKAYIDKHFSVETELVYVPLRHVNLVIGYSGS